jgi:hypothetical protein
MHMSQVLTQLVSAANNAQSSNRNNASKKQMAEHSHAMREAISLFAPVIKSYSDDPHNPQRQLTFINESKNLLEPGAKFVATTKVASTSVGDKAVAKQMDNFSRYRLTHAFGLPSTLECIFSIQSVRHGAQRAKAGGGGGR